jgi:hypothetical protein
MKSKLLAMSLGTVLLLAACGKDGTVVNPITEPVITDITTIAQTADRRSLVGRKVELSGVTVQSVVGTFVFWTGDPRSGLPAVRLDRMNGTATEHVKRNDRVRITGTVRLLESTSPTDQMWDKINEAERRDILGAVVYIAADRVSIIH